MFLPKIIFVLSCEFIILTSSVTPAIDKGLQEEALDSEQCKKQLSFLRNDTLLLNYIDASAKVPSGVFSGNVMDLGSYYDCLDINTVRDDFHFEGKYCTIFVPIDQFKNELFYNIIEASDEKVKRVVQATEAMGRSIGERPINSGSILAYCIPKVCSLNETLGLLLNPLTQAIGFTYAENGCRLRNDKPFVPADYVAIVFLVVFALLTIISTTYDLYCVFHNHKVSNKLGSTFSIYTNVRRFLSFSASNDNLPFVDGIRSLSMLWIIVGHTYSMTLKYGMRNSVGMLDFLLSRSSVWLTSALISVDTFLLLSGILCVYSTIPKVSKRIFIRNLHLFYLSRLLRMFPLLAVVVLLQASLFNHVSDGPLWSGVEDSVKSCQEYWWSALLHVQNYVNPANMCLGQTWYLSLDIQMYMVCPIILVFLFGKRLLAWSALFGGLLVSLTTSTVYSVANNFQGGPFDLHSQTDLATYMNNFYVNSLTRAPPFFVGMLIGYLLYTTREHRIVFTKLQTTMLWLIALGMMCLATFPNYDMTQPGYDNQAFVNFYNSCARAIWAMAVGWIIVACQHGYAGPVNWFLSLPMWKLPARLSYALYLVHYPLLNITNASWLEPAQFAHGDNFYRFLTNVSLSTIIGFVLCVTIDAPFTNLQKILFTSLKTPKKPVSDVLASLPKDVLEPGDLKTTKF